MSGKKENILYRYFVKTDNKEKFYTHLIILLFGIFWSLFLIINFHLTIGMIENRIRYNVNPLPEIIITISWPAFLILIGYLGIKDYYQRKKKQKNDDKKKLENVI